MSEGIEPTRVPIPQEKPEHLEESYLDDVYAMDLFVTLAKMPRGTEPGKPPSPTESLPMMRAHFPITKIPPGTIEDLGEFFKKQLLPEAVAAYAQGEQEHGSKSGIVQAPKKSLLVPRGMGGASAPPRAGGGIVGPGGKPI